MFQNRMTFNRDETYEEWRQRLLDETARFIEWGLAHPEDVPRIPTQVVGRPPYAERAKALFWSAFLRDDN